MAFAQSPVPSSAPTTEADAIALTPLAAPKNAEQADALRTQIQERIAALPPLEPLPDVDSSGLKIIEAAKQLKAAFDAYLLQLDGLVESQQRATQLGSEEEITKRNRQVEEYKQRISDLAAIGTGPIEGDPVIARGEIAAEYDRVNALFDTANQQQTKRAAALASLPQRTEAAAVELAEARARIAEAMREPATPPDGMDHASFDRMRDLQLEALTMQVSIANLHVERAASEKVVLELESAAASTVLPVLQNYAKALGECRSRLDEATTRSETETIAANLEKATTSHERAYWTHRSLIAETRREFASKLDGIRIRFRESDRQRLVRKIETQVGFYERLKGRLDRIEGPEKSAAYRRLDDLRSEFGKRLQTVGELLNQARREKDQLDASWDIATDRLAESKDKLQTAASRLQGTERADFDKLLAEIASQYRPALDQTVADVGSAEKDSIARLEVTEADIRAFLDKLAGYRETFFWSFTLARGPNLIDGVNRAREQVVAEQFRSDFGAAIARVRDQLSAISRMRWLLAGGLAVLGLVAGLFMRFHLMQIADAHTETLTASLQEKEVMEVGLADRGFIQFTRMLGELLPIGLPAALLLLVGLAEAHLSGEPRLLALRLLGLLLVAVVLRAVVGRLFRAVKPRFRVIPCSMVVAQYYRTWLLRLWLLSVILIVPIIVVSSLDICQPLQDALWAVFYAAGLLVLLLFGRKRQSVVRVVGRAYAQRRPYLFTFVVRIYPLLYLSLVVLFVMCVIGYVTFVDYVVRNVLQTVCVLVVAWLLADLASDLARRYTSRPAPEPEPEQDQPATQPETTGADIDAMFDEFEARELGLLVRSVTAVSRWVIWCSAILWIAASWGMTTLAAKQALTFPIAQTEGGAITVQRVLAALLALVIAVKLSRGLRAVLDEKVYPAYPTVNRAAQATINSLLHYTLLVVGLYIALQLVHLNFGALAVLLGGLGLGLGLGLQPLVVNFVSGLLIFAERHIKVGDLVEVDGEVGEVAGISMRSTQIRSFDNIDRIIPNSQFMTSTVTNWTLRDTKIRGKISVGVAYGTDTKRVHDLLLEIAKAEPLVHADPEPAVWFVNFGDSSLDFILACWFSSPGDRWAGMVNMRYTIDSRFKEEGIEIPFPQRTLSVHPDAEFPVRVVRPDRKPPESNAD